jgi:hypothetical protein
MRVIVPAVFFYAVNNFKELLVPVMKDVKPIQK